MNCHKVQRTLSVRDPQPCLGGSGTPETDDAIHRHLEECAICGRFLVQLEQVEACLRAQEAPLPSAELKVRIAAGLKSAARPDESPCTPGSSRLTAGLFWLKENGKMVRRLSWGGAALLGLALVVFLQQSGRANGPLKRMGDAARAVHSVHLIGWNCELRPEVAAAVKQGRTQIGFNEVVPRRFEAWIQGGRWREDQDFDATVYERGRVWRNGVISSGENTPPLLTSFAYRAITGEDPFGKGVDYTSRVLDEKVMDGRPVTRLLVESKKAALPDGTHPIDEQRLFWLDSQSYLPIRMEEMRYDQDRWALDAVIWFDYDVRVSDKLFDPAAARAERHGAVDMTQHPAKDFYRLTDEQHARYMAIMGAPDTEKARIEADPQLSRAQKDALLVAHSQQFLDRIRKFLDPDQRRLFDDWWYIQPRILDKLATPAQRAEEAKWRAEQQKQMNEWLATFDPETRKRLAGGNQGSAGVVQP